MASSQVLAPVMSETTSHDRPQERMTPFATNGHTVHPSVPSHEIQASHAQHESRGPADDPLCDNEFGIAKNAIEAPRAVPPDSDEDAEGDDDGEFDIDATANDNGLMRLDTPEFATTTRPLKRKSDADEDDFMSQNPELYGLRRSGRAQPRRVIDSLSESNDDSDDAPRRPAKRRRSGHAQQENSVQYQAPAHASSESDEGDAYQGSRNRLASTKGRHRLKLKSRQAEPSHAEVRFSTRQSAKVSNYNEDEDDGMFDEDDVDDTSPNYWVASAEDTGPAIDIVLNHRLIEPEKHGHQESPDKHQYEFFIKWQGKAHLHATWELWSTLSSLRGFRRLENYFRKIIREEQYLLSDPDVAPEEREKWNLDRETYLEALEEYMKVERVIGSRMGDDDETEYYIKWRGLTYDLCTWETATVTGSLAQTEIDRFLDRSIKLPTSDRKEASIATRSPHKVLRAQPDYIKHGQLRDFQLTGLNFLAYNWCMDHNVVLADEMGLGKTVQTVAFMNWLRHDRGQQGPFLVIVPLSTMPAWADTFNNWAPDINYVIYNGNEAARQTIQQYELLVDGNPRKPKFHVLLTTYEFILIDSTFLSQLKWQFMAVDEAHRLKNKESQLYVKLMDFHVPSRLLITGTPLQNNLTELSALMSFLMPGRCSMDEEIDLNSENAKQQLDELNQAIKPFMIRRTKQKVENDLPPKSEKIIRVELADVQLDYYKNILTRNYAALNAGAKGQKQSLLNVMMELKKASNHPFMFPSAEERLLAGSTSREEQLKAIITSSGKMMLLDQLLTKMKKDNHRVLIFSQMVKLLDILGDYLQLRGHQYQRLDGTIPSATRRHAIDHFNAPDSKDFCFILSTRAGGLGINLMTADTVILFDSDWNPQADLQAMARAHRIGQKKPVTIYRLVSKDTIEEEILERARNKLMLEYITIHRAVTDQDAKHINDKLNKAGVNVAEPSSGDDISRILKRRGQKMFEQSGNQKKLEELNIDAVLAGAEDLNTDQDQGINADGGEDFLKSFEYTDVKVDLEWDEIIPKEQLEKIKAEEKRKQEELYLESVIEQNQPRKRKAAADDARAQRAAKKRAMDLAAEAAADAESGDDSETNKDPKRPLNEKELRNLVRAFERYGLFDDRREELVKEARLVGRDVEVIKATMDEIVEMAQRLTKEEEDRVRKIEKDTNKPIAKKDRKAVLFDYKGVKRLNAETLVERPAEMRVLRDMLANTSNWRNFRVPEATKSAAYTAPWGAREDGMLCIGINRYGYGAWAMIRDDPEFDMHDKFYLEEHRLGAKEGRAHGDEKNIKSPGAVHLVRRANYLLGVLKEKNGNGNAKGPLDNHFRNNRRNHPSLGHKMDRTGSMSASPAPGSSRKVQREDSQRRRPAGTSEKGPSERRLPGSPEKHARRPAGELESSKAKMDSTAIDRPPGTAIRDFSQLFSPILDDLKLVSTATKQDMPDNEERLRVIKQVLISIGRHIEVLMINKSLVNGSEAWKWVSRTYWPQAKKKDSPQVDGDKLRELYHKMTKAEAKMKAASAGFARGPNDERGTGIKVAVKPTAQIV